MTQEAVFKVSNDSRREAPTPAEADLSEALVPDFSAWENRELTHEDQHALWRNITCPVLLVRGAESWASDPVKDGRIENFRNARLVNFEGAGHWVHHDQLDAFMAETEAFLAE